MPTPAADFDLVLAYPQWQGSGRARRLPRGAAAAARVCARYGPTAAVPLSGEGAPHGGVNRWTAILDQFRAAQAILSAHDPRRVLAAGGDCACDVAVIDHLRRRHPDLTVVWIDAHLDANTPQTSPSGNFHGMPVATLMGQAPPDLVGLTLTEFAPADEAAARDGAAVLARICDAALGR
ncbi:arginase family protein [Phenylobacterium sp.]|uniref:arginase family protein n=1 Tax=Phenylobacterium sp. TaxID=1871053 RepID=UPI003928A916